MDSDNVPPTPPLPLPDDFLPAEAGPLDSAPPSGESPPPPPRWPDRPWLTIWTAPRGTIRAILDADRTRHVLLLAALAGIAQSLGQASNNNTGDDLPFWSILLLAIVLGPIGGIVALYIQGLSSVGPGACLGVRPRRRRYALPQPGRQCR